MADKAGQFLTAKFLACARDLAEATTARAILVYADVFKKPGPLEQFIKECDRLDVVLATRDPELFEECRTERSRVIAVPPIRLTRAGQIKLALLLGFTEGIFKTGDRIICLSGIVDSGIIDQVTFMETREELEMFASSLGEQLTHSARPDVFERVLAVAVQLGHQGREGKPVGTTFVIGDTEAVLKNSDQMILNPFRGYSREERSILDAGVAKTVKEFATIDGAFIITGDGFVDTAGAYLRSTVPGAELPRGLGARHASAAAITAATDAVAVTVSESTGTVHRFPRRQDPDRDRKGPADRRGRSPGRKV